MPACAAVIVIYKRRCRLVCARLRAPWDVPPKGLDSLVTLNVNAVLPYEICTWDMLKRIENCQMKAVVERKDPGYENLKLAGSRCKILCSSGPFCEL